MNKEEENITDKIKESLLKLPEFLTTQHLVDIGLYPNRPSVHLARSRGQAPDCMRIGKKIVFPRAAIIEFVLSNMEQKKVIND